MDSSDEQNSQPQKYIILEKISQGSYGNVYKAKNRYTHQIVAIKQFKNIAKQGIPVSCLRQINIMNILQKDPYFQSQQEFHSNKRLLRLVEVTKRKGQIIMVIQWMDTTLKKIIQSANPYPVKRIMHQILLNLQVMHRNLIWHRDIKPSNIMIKYSALANEEISILKIVDFGMAKQDNFLNNHTNQVGSLYYRAPELLLGSTKYSQTIDIWAVGCVFYELLTKEVLFKGNNELQQLIKIFQTFGIPQQEKHPQLYSLFSKNFIKTTDFQIDANETIKTKLQNSKSKIGSVSQNENQIQLLMLMLQLQPGKRISVQQALKHNCFK